MCHTRRSGFSIHLVQSQWKLITIPIIILALYHYLIYASAVTLQTGFQVLTPMKLVTTLVVGIAIGALLTLQQKNLAAWLNDRSFVQSRKSVPHGAMQQ